MKKRTTPLARVRARRSRVGSSALVIVLSFVVLLTVVVLAMLSHSISSGLVSSASSNVTKTDLYGHGAINQVIGDLEQEIVAGSANLGANTNTVGVYTNAANVVTYIYRPTYVTNSVPYNSGPSTYTTTTWNSTLPNLVKQSTYGVPFEPYDATVPQRAAAVSTDSQSDPYANKNPNSVYDVGRNGRYVSVTRWNKPLLLPKLSATISGGSGGTATTITDTGTITTPVASFVAPDWILTPADGSVDAATSLDFSTTGTTSNILPKSPKYIVGRYAYTIYNEGGLLDANVAGCLSSRTTDFSSTPQASAIISQKGPAAFADLTQLPGIASLTGSRPQLVVDSLIGWRNAASAQSAASPFPNYSFTNPTLYFNYLLGLSTNFMSAGNTSLVGGLSDRFFTSRQQLISFFQNDIAQTSTEQANLQDAMMYLGTFSRTLNQPSYWPDPSRPKETGTWPPGLWNSTTYNGWNRAPGSLVGATYPDNEDSYNPALRTKRVTTSFVRPSGAANDPSVNPDGTTANVGDPLIKKRFPLSRLMWLTYKGPSANIPTTDDLFLAYQQFYTGSSSGTPPDWLVQLWKEGTGYTSAANPGNIYNYFGLKWGTDPINPGSGSDGALSNRGGSCWTYGHDQTDTAITPAATLIATPSQIQALGREPDFFELLQAGIKIGGIATDGILGSFDKTSKYCQSSDTQPIYQILQLGANIIDEANPTQFPTHIEFTANLSGTTGVTASVYGAMDLPYLYEYAEIGFVNATGTTGTVSGSIAGLIVPVVWNPYDVNGPSTATYSSSTALYPSLLRITALTSALVSPTTSGYPWGAVAWTGTASAVTGGNVPAANFVGETWATENQTALNFNNPAPATSSPSALYREPVALDQLDPSSAPLGSGLTGSGLALGDTANNLLVTAGFTGFTTTGGVPEAGSGNKFVGFLLSTCPQYWAAGGPVKQVTPSNPTFAITFRMEYQPPGTAIWEPYQEYYVNGDQTGFSIPTNGTTYFYSSTPATSTLWNIGTAARILWDPRTNRWSTTQNASNGQFTDATGTTIQSVRPSKASGTSTNMGATAGWLVPAQNYIGLVTQNNSSSTEYYNDPDAVIRRAMGGYVPVSSGTATTTVGLPLADYTGTSSQNPGAQSQSRPIILHRPYRSVAELGCVFSGTPFRNIDFFTPESSYSALLDMFCINEDYRADAVAAGRVDLNTKQAPVLQALLAGAYRDEEHNFSTPPTGSAANLVNTEAVAISQGLVSRTTVGVTNNPKIITLKTSPQPLSNIADLVGRWALGSGSTPTVAMVNNNKAYDGSISYDGFSADLGSLYTNTASYSILQRFRETTMRALSDAGQAGTWNLLIDVVAQSGHYPADATNLSDFLVEGERRYWVHVAIDRQTGQVIDENIEPVNE